MRKISFLAVLAALTIVAVSCVTREEKCRKWGICGKNSDSLVYIEKLTTDTFIQDDSQVWIDMLLECDSTGEVYIDRIDRLETDNSDLQFRLQNNRVYVYMDKAADTIYAKGKDITKVEKITNVVEVNRLKTWQKVLIWFGVLFIASVIIFGYIMVRSFVKGNKSL